MNYMNIRRPLYPRPGNSCGACDSWDKCGGRACFDRSSWRMPLFDCDRLGSGTDCGCGSQTVRLENPCCPGECAEVTLSVDNCGNLVICVHKNPWRNDCGRPGKRC